MKNILAIFPHPDDTAFFAAGTLARWAKEGHAITSVCCTNGNLGTLRLDRSMDQVAEIRAGELRAANAILGVRETLMLGYPDGGMMDGKALKEELIGLIRKLRPDRLLTLDPWRPYEVHPDHVTVGHMATQAAAFASFPLLHPQQINADIRPHSPAEIWLMGVLGSEPNCFVDISSTLDTKVAALLEFEATLAILASMFAPGIDPASVSPEQQETLARHADTQLRSMAGRMGKAVGLAAAEAFIVKKCLPGHFDDRDESLGRMLGEPSALPRVIT